MGVLRDTATTINDGNDELINREYDDKMKDNPSKPRSIQSQGKKMKLVTISVCKRWRNHQGECKNVTNIRFNYGREGHFAQKCISKRGEGGG